LVGADFGLPFEVPFQPAEQRERQHHHHGSEDAGPVVAAANSHADAGQDENGGGGGEAVDGTLSADDGASADEADAGNEVGRDAGGVAAPADSEELGENGGEGQGGGHE